MKKELKRYSLCEYCGEQVRYYNNYEDYQKLLIMIDKLNKSGKNQFYFGNVSCEFSGDLYRVSIHVYNRLTPKMTISDIDNLTMDKTEESLIEDYKDLIRTRKPFTPDINIMYFEEKNSLDRDSKSVVKRIKYIPVLYKRDIRFLDRDYIKNCISYSAREKDVNFFREIANEFCFHHIVSNEIEKIRHYIDLCERGEDYYSELSYFTKSMFDKLIKERNADKTLYRNEKGECQISRRRLRDFGFFVRDYMIPLNKKNIPTRYNKELTQKQMEELFGKEEVVETKQELPNAMQLTLF